MEKKQHMLETMTQHAECRSPL